LYQECCARDRTASGHPLSRFPTASFDVLVDTFGKLNLTQPLLHQKYGKSM
jgi:hypothetical protein